MNPDSPPPKRQRTELGEEMEHVMNAADVLEQSRNVSFGKARDANRVLLEAMNKLESSVPPYSPKYKLVTAQFVLESIYEGINGHVTESNGFQRNQLSGINQHGDLSKVIQLLISWIQGGPERLSIRICDLFSSWSAKYENQRGIGTLVTWPPSDWPGVPVYSLTSVKDPRTTINLKLSGNTLLRHATSTENALEIIKNSTVEDGYIRLTGAAANTQAHKGCVPLVWTGVALNEAQINPVASGARKYVKENRYGSVIFEFPIQSRCETSGVGRAYILGTKKYQFEHSQVIVIPRSNSDEFTWAVNTTKNQRSGSEHVDKIIQMEEIKLDGFPWDLSYSDAEWTHPEIAFMGHKDILISDLSISFTDHSCIKQKKDTCHDCSKGFKEATTARAEFKRLLCADKMSSTELQNLIRKMRPAFKHDSDFEMLLSMSTVDANNE